MFAIARNISAGFANALAAEQPDPPIDVALARVQHAAYCKALGELGLAVSVLPNQDTLPDACFVEDTAVVAGGIALITRPGAPSRRDEVETVATALARSIEIVRMTEPATLDGGDCMRVGRTIYVGRSARTNDAGIAQLSAVFAPRGFRVVPIELPAGVLHLKCVCAPLADDRITLADGTIPRHVFEGVDVVAIPAAESYAANVLAYGGRVLVADGFPRAADALHRAGLAVTPLATTEFRKADGALTCLSIVF